MRLVQVAKALGMTGQQLRKELTKVDFGVKPTDREISDQLAQGIIRYFARQQGLDVDMDALGLGSGEEEDDEEQEGAAEQVSEESETEQSDDATPQTGSEKRKQRARKKTDDSKKELHVLRKLTLDDVSQEAIAQEEKKLSKQSSTKKQSPVSEKQESTQQQTQKERTEAAPQQQIKKKEGTVTLPAQITVKEFAEKAGVQVPQVVQALMSNGVMATVNQTIDYDTAAIVAGELGVEVRKEQDIASAEDLVSRNLEELLKDEPEHLVSRPPVVTVMGHVDHGKTSILDAFRESDVVGGEAGGITQHIGAYQVEHPVGEGDVRRVTFLDTPGHEAFTAMRARGAQVTDMAVLVVAADEGVKPTTVEAIDHAKEAGVPILVAVNKVDLENADPDKVKGELAQHGLQPDDWGGETPVVLCSAQSGKGISELLDAIILLADMTELKANPNRSAVATVIESHLHSSLGPLATVVVNTGTLRQSDAYVCGKTTGRVRAMMDEHGQRLEEVGPSGAVQVSGLSSVAQVGDILQVVPSEQEAKRLVEQVKESAERGKKSNFADLVSRLSEGKMHHLKVVLKADTQGSLDAVREALQRKGDDEVAVKVIHAAIGSVSETDVMMASASDGLVVAFHVDLPPTVSRAAEREGVKVREYDVIYTLLEDVDGLLSGLVEPEEEEQILGHVEIRALFLDKKSEQIVGGRVTDGVAKRLPYRILRDGEEVGTGRITSLRKVDKDVKEIGEGNECGMRTDSTTPIQEGDVLEIFLKEFKKKR